MSAKVADINTIIGKVITRSHIIEKLLRTHYNTAGRGLHKAIDDLTGTLPAVLARTIRVIAIVRNDAAHPDKFTHETVPQDFDRLCDEIEVLIPYFAGKRASKPDTAPTNAAATTSNDKAPEPDIDTILKRLIKLKPSRRTAAINSIKSMSHPVRPISDEAANRILEALLKRGSLTIDANNKLQINDAQ